MVKSKTYTRHPDHVACISGPHVRLTGTHEGLRVTVWHVLADGRVVFTAPTAWLCNDWLVRTGWH